MYPPPEKVINCIESWKKYCDPNAFEIIEWNENNFDINYNEYVKEAYAAKKWAFVSDVARAYALVNFGGIYLDTDVELIKPFGDLLNLDAFLGFESGNNICSAVMGCNKNNPLFVELLDSYNNNHFLKPDGTCDYTTNVERFTKICIERGLIKENRRQDFDSFSVFPIDYFSPKDLVYKTIALTENTVSIHHFDGSWASEDSKYENKLYFRLNKFMPKKLSHSIAVLITTIKYKGIKAVFEKISAKIKKSKMKKNSRD